MTQDIQVRSDAELSNSFIGDTIQVCVVTRDLKRRCEGFVQMGIGPWRVYTFSPDTVSDQTYKGAPVRQSMRLAVAMSGNMMWEVIEPLEGPSIYKDYLANNEEGVQHVGQACNGMSFDEQVAQFEARGLSNIQSGCWQDKVRYAYFSTGNHMSTTVEIFDFPENFVWPEPEAWIPAAP